MTAVIPQRPVGGRLIDQFEYGLDAPICLTWELTYACNLSCVHCLSSSGRRDPRELTTAQAEAVIDELERMQVFYVNIGGGEPTVRPDFWHLVDYATEHHVGVKFSTNGFRITPERAERLAATDYVVPALEIVDARVQDPRKIFDTVADNGAAAGIVMGGRPVRPMDVDLRWVGGIMYVNSEIEETGVAAGVLGHPAMGVAWLANKLGSLGTPMEPGHIVLAGSFTRVVFAKKGDTLHGDFGQLGGISVQFV